MMICSFLFSCSGAIVTPLNYFANNKTVNKVAFHDDNKINPSRLLSWTADGYGFIDTMRDDKIAEIQELADTLCGVKKQQSDEKPKAE